ncbi:MAG: N-6 DNA methylase [Actinomycetota bacterium]|nr:N-6 DNA methylase [Actinomycetota bacterium]
MGELASLPNLIYTDGNEFALVRDGKLVGEVVRFSGDIETAGADLDAPPGLVALFGDFFRWNPSPPRDARQLAEMSARLCRLLRDEVSEQVRNGSLALTALATDWRRLFFPEASDEEFADGYAQAVTFGMLMARAREISLDEGLDRAARELGRTSSLIGAALHFLTFNAENQATLKTSLGTLSRVLHEVHWPAISKGDPDAWLYFYEDFLEVYDNELRKKTGSYYTPPEVVNAMIRLTDDVLRERFDLPAGLASPEVAVADPAVGTGTFILGILRRIAATVEADEGSGAVSAAVRSAVERLVAFEIQLGPFAVAQLRILGELAEIMGPDSAPPELRMFVTDALANPYAEMDWIPAIFGSIAESRRRANEIKLKEPITVVIGNPPYKEKAKGRGGWVESGDAANPAPLAEWTPPPEWGVSAHTKHLRNLYVYFWRWATWKVFDHDPASDSGIVCFITVAGFLGGDGFQKMRDYLRRTTAEVWVIDCSPEGHQPEVNTRVFEAVQQPVCIVLASRSPETDPSAPAKVRFRRLPAGHRREKFAALEKLTLHAEGWRECPTGWRAPFFPKGEGAWATYPALEDLFAYDGSGVMPGRTWILAPDKDSLISRWKTLTNAPPDKKEDLFHPHLRGGKPGDKHTKKEVKKGLPGYEANFTTVADERGDPLPPARYGFRSFDRQWIIPDNRLINQPNAKIWEVRSKRQVYLTALSKTSPSSGPALTFTGNIPDLDHYNGRGGRVFPLWGDRGGGVSNVRRRLLAVLGERYGREVGAEDFVACIAGVAAHPAFTGRFGPDLVQPGLRVPITADGETFAEAAELGREVVWLHTFGERFADPGNGCPARPPRLPSEDAPRIPEGGAIPASPMPDEMSYDPSERRLHVGGGYVENVAHRVWEYEVSGKKVLRQWFSYRKANRERPIIGDRRPPSKLGEIQPEGWPAEYTTEFMNVLNVLGRLVEIEASQAELLERTCSAETISDDELREAGAFDADASGGESAGQAKLLDE